MNSGKVQMKTDKLRKTYLDFFRSKDHRVFSSDSLVPPGEDKSLLFTGAGMNQFKPYFMGLKKDIKRATSCQKCLRTADLDRVGKTAYHHTFFEMLGNFSFGDYFKEQAISWGWEFVTKALGLPKEKLWVSVYQEDGEAFNIWKSKVGLPESRIVYMGPEDNFWPANAPKDGPNGPCGPCSEIYVGETPSEGVEIWNLVFTQFDRQSDGSLKPLPQKNIDTGMGLERTAAMLQGVGSNFDTDNFQKIRAELKRLLKPGSNETAHENAVMDHIRAIVFSIADGALPSNDGRGYVIRKIIRLGSEHLTKAGANRSEKLSKLAPVIVDVYGKNYPEIAERARTIISIIENEERSYAEVLRTQIPKMKQVFTSVKQSAIPETWPSKTAGHAFKFYDTLGLPLDVIREIAIESGLQLDEEQFNLHLNEQKKRSRESSKIAGEIFSKDNKLGLIEGLPASKFLGYEATETKGKLLKTEGSLLIFDQTPFYAESGGQIGDTGEILGKNFKAEVLDTQFIDKCIAHKVRIVEGQPKEGETYNLKIDADRRADIMKNHSATHLLHSALRKVLGDHVKQSGSLVAPDRLRFDFTHFSALDSKSMAAVEELVNAEVRKNIKLDKKVMSKEKAIEAGAVAFFGEKYGDEVRVVTMGDFSKELCGGTHLNSTGEIGMFKIVSESSIQAGVRRIEAVTGRGANAYAENIEKDIKNLAREFDCDPKELFEKFLNLRNRFGELDARLKNIYKEIERNRTKENLTEKFNDISIYTRFNDKVRSDTFSVSISYLKTLNIPFVALFQGTADDKVMFAIGASSDLIQKGFHAGKIIKPISEKVGGKGGGKPDYAVGGGKILSNAKEAFELGKKIIKEELNSLSIGHKK